MIIFDTETTGLSAYDNQICQLSYIKLNQDYSIEYAKNFYFMVKQMESEAQWVHGLSMESLEELSYGKVFKDFAEEIYNDFLNTELLIGHNVEFDYNFLTSEFSDAGFDIKPIEEKKTFCTMHSYTNIVKTGWSDYHQSYRWPRLNKVVSFLGLDDDKLENATIEIFNIEKSRDFHDSRYDAVATLEAYKVYQSKYRRVVEYELILQNIDLAQNILERIKAFFEINKYKRKSGIDVPFDADIDCVYNKFNKDYPVINSYIDSISNCFKPLSRLENTERERLIKIAENELISLLESKTTSGAEVIKALRVHTEGWRGHNFYIVPDCNIEIENEDEINVELIEIGYKEYIMINSSNKSVMSIIKLSSVGTTLQVANNEEVGYTIISDEECPNFEGKDDIKINNINNYKIIDNTELLGNCDYKPTSSDDELPF